MSNACSKQHCAPAAKFSLSHFVTAKSSLVIHGICVAASPTDMKIGIDAFVKSKFEMRSKLYTKPINRYVECCSGVFPGTPSAEHHCHCPGKSGVHQTTQQQ